MMLIIMHICLKQEATDEMSAFFTSGSKVKMTTGAGNRRQPLSAKCGLIFKHRREKIGNCGTCLKIFQSCKKTNKHVNRWEMQNGLVRKCVHAECGDIYWTRKRAHVPTVDALLFVHDSSWFIEARLSTESWRDAWRMSHTWNLMCSWRFCHSDHSVSTSCDQRPRNALCSNELNVFFFHGWRRFWSLAYHFTRADRVRRNVSLALFDEQSGLGTSSYCRNVFHCIFAVSFSHHSSLHFARTKESWVFVLRVLLLL